MIENIGFFYRSVLEADNFPGWEIYILLQLLLWISIIIRLTRIERKLDPLTQDELDLLINGYDTPDRKRNIMKSKLWWVRKKQHLHEEER
tara:strand:+ start:1114 stop:1383 length:270 start_codon:yes stop_codon:yes gene_type:complete